MYQKLEKAIDILLWMQYHSRATQPMRRAAEIAEQSIREYIEEGYKMKEETTLGD